MLLEAEINAILSSPPPAPKKEEEKKEEASAEAAPAEVEASQEPVADAEMKEEINQTAPAQPDVVM